MLKTIVERSAGLDVHKQTVVATVLCGRPDGEIEERTKEFSTFPQGLKLLAEWLVEQKAEVTVMESTGIYWKSVYEALEKAGIKAYVVNARQVKQIPGHKTDVTDSKWLATLARFGLLKASFIPEKELRDLRLLTRYRIKLKNMIASEVNRSHKVLDDAGIRLGIIISDLQGVSGQAIIDGLIKDEPVGKLVSYLKGTAKKKSKEMEAMLTQPLGKYHKRLLQQIRKHMEYMQKECEQLDKEIFAAMKPYEQQWKILQTIPGIDALSAAIIITEIGIDMKPFGSSEQFCSWAGICPGNNESAGKRKSGRIRKGAPILCSILCEVANSAIRTTSQFKGYYQNLMLRRGHKRSVIATGHKILRVIYKLLMVVKPYHDSAINYEEILIKRNAPRWIQALTKYGYITRAV